MYPRKNIAMDVQKIKQIKNELTFMCKKHKRLKDIYTPAQKK